MHSLLCVEVLKTNKYFFGEERETDYLKLKFYFLIYIILLLLLISEQAKDYRHQTIVLQVIKIVPYI